MITVRHSNKQSKKIKNVVQLEDGKIRYESYMFLWPTKKSGTFRLIYNNFGHCTAWKLNTETGIWGCFADSNDIGFDRKTIAIGSDDVPRVVIEKPKHTISLRDTNEPTQSEIFEKIEDQIADAYFAQMQDHIAALFAAG